MTVTTGMSISGKMSVRIWRIDVDAEHDDQQGHHDERVRPRRASCTIHMAGHSRE